MNQRIYIKDWLKLKPYKKQTLTDIYYLKRCNDIKEVVTTHKHLFVLQRFLNNEGINLLSCFLTSYFEDLISETNIWNSFVRAHQRLYGKQLPFYNLDEYYEEEINPQDISFLIWYFLNTVQDEKFISPFNYLIVEMAEEIYDVFDKEWELAPVNQHLQKFYQIDQKQNDYYIARYLIDTVLFKTYLFYPDTSLKLQEQTIEIVKNTEDENDLNMFLNENRDDTLHKSHTRLLALKGKEWVSEIIGSNHLLTKDILTISEKIQGLFLYKGQDDNHIFIEHIASGKKFDLTKKSFEDPQTLKEVDTILYIGIVMWKDEWWFSGIFFQLPFNPKLIHDEKNSIESKIAVDFLDYQEQEADKILENQLKAFKEFNNGSQIAFLPSERIEEFYKQFIEFFNNTLNVTEKDIREAKQGAGASSYFDTQETFQDFSQISETGLVFFNPNSGAEIALTINSAFPMPANPYFKEKDSEEHVIRLLMSENFSKELVMYCIDNCKTKLSFFTKDVEKKYLEDMDFLLRFWKSDNYHTQPNITFTSHD